MLLPALPPDVLLGHFSVGCNPPQRKHFGGDPLPGSRRVPPSGRAVLPLYFPLFPILFPYPFPLSLFDFPFFDFPPFFGGARVGDVSLTHWSGSDANDGKIFSGCFNSATNFLASAHVRCALALLRWAAAQESMFNSKSATS